MDEVLGTCLVAAWPEDAENLVAGNRAGTAWHWNLPRADTECDHSRVDLEAKILLQTIPCLQRTERHLVRRPGRSVP